VDIAGDGRGDVPGFPAKYLTFSLHAAQLKKILHLEHVQVGEVSSSYHGSLALHKSSKHVFLECLEKVKDRGLNVVSLTIDRHVQVAKHMRTEEPAIRHSFYSWHLSKNTENTSWDLGLILHIQQKSGPLRL
ncbi:hypothetical protein HPB47_016575, partial [Ixodes persulcatus]